jgi:serine/threonine protein kinase
VWAKESALPLPGEVAHQNCSLAPFSEAMTTLTKAGRYEIQAELGRGAMGVVYRAADPVIGRTVAVKTLRLSQEGTGLTHPEMLARFQTEARAAGVLTHPNIVVVYDAGEEDGLYYITMELVEGKSLQALLDAGQTFPLPRVLRIMEQACSALQFAHERNIVHRDIKPANLMLTGDDIVKVTDFGTAKILQFGTVQQTAHVMGTPSYMSPEQVKGKVVDGRSDIFSLGVMLYEMVTSEKPFPGQNITTVIYKIVNEEPVPPRQIDPSIHPGLSAVIVKALAKDPDARYQSCRDLMEDLKNYRGVVPAANPQSTVALGATPEATAVLTPGPGRAVEDTSALARSLSARTASPMHTPAVRRTGAISPVQKPKKKNRFLTALIAMLLLAFIVYGARKIRPDIEAARERNQALRTPDAGGTPASSSGTENSTSTPGNGGDSAERGNDSENEATPAVKPNSAKTKTTEVQAQPVAARGSGAGLTPAAAEYKGRVEEAISLKGLTGKVRVRGTGNTLTLSGKLRPGEHTDLLKFLKAAPSGVQVVDDILYDDTATPGGATPDSGGHPVATPGRGAIHVITNVVGATAMLPAAHGQPAQQCETPCSFVQLAPGQYNLEVRKNGFQPMQTALQIRSGEVLDEKVTLEPLAVGLFISSNPPGADVFINGAKQSGQTPVTLPLAPGQYNLVLRLEGFQAYSQQVSVKDNVQTRLQVDLKPRGAHVAWAQVNSHPAGAEIFVDGTSTGKFSPARVQIPSGIHNILLKLNGYRPFRTSVQASEGGTVAVEGTLHQF